MAAAAAKVEIQGECLAAISAWKAAAGAGWRGLAVGVDVGATNTRVGCAPVASSDASAYRVLCAFEADDATQLYAGLSAAAEALPERASAACIDAAGPVLDGGARVVITNWPEAHVREIALSRIDPRVCPGGGRTALLNDLEAACHGVLGLSGAARMADFFVPLQQQKKEEGKEASCAGTLPCVRHLVMAMGTGLGVGVLVPSSSSSSTSSYSVLPVEIGHTLVTAFGTEYPGAARDAAFVSWLGHRLYGGQHLAEFEDVCSGRGLRYAYEFACLGVCDPKDATPKDIAELAQAGNPQAVAAMRDHYKFLFRVAQNCCVGLQTKCVVLAGDNQVANHWFVSAHADELALEFSWHPKQRAGKDRWLENIPFFIQNRKVNTNMIGDIRVAQALALK